jgi:catechol-2,3-dioxygenase
MSQIPLIRTNTILYCQRWTETVQFYKNVINLPVSFENDWFIEFQLTETSYLSIANSARASINDVQGQGVTLTWQVTDLAQVKARLDRQAVTTTPIKEKWSAQVFYCHDPEGHRLEFWAEDK